MKMPLSYKDIHPGFKLNGISYGPEALRKLAYDLVKEGTDDERPLGEFLGDWLDEREFIAVRTSGSTGTPKTIPLKKQHMVQSARATARYFDLQPGNTALLCLPIEYIAGKMMLVRAMVLGLELDAIPPSKHPLTQGQPSYDFCAMVPLQLRNSLAYIERIQTLIVGGAPLSAPLREALRGKSTAVYETYGMTETCTHIAVRNSAEFVGANRSGFMALPDVQFKVDERDCLVIVAPKIADAPVVTNDIVRLVSDVEFEWLGRYDNVINSGGVKLFPEQIEAKLLPFLSCPFFVGARPDEELGQKLVLVIEGDIDIDRLRQTLKRSTDLDRFELPREIYTLAGFLKTDTGKIRRKETLKLLGLP